MPNDFRLFKYIFFAAVLVMATGVCGYELLWSIPMKKCEAAGNWWSWKYRCQTPVYLPSITHRPVVKSGAAGSSASDQVTIDFHDAKKPSDPAL